MNIEKRLSIWRIPIVGKTLFYRLFVKQEGGELTSDSLRELIYRNYKVSTHTEDVSSLISIINVEGKLKLEGTVQ